MKPKLALVLATFGLSLLTPLLGNEAGADSLPSTVEGLIDASVQTAKAEVELVEGFKVDADVFAGKAKWLEIKKRQSDVMRALAQLPEPDEKEQARLMAKYGPAMEGCRRRMVVVEKRLPLVAKVNVELIRESVMAGTTDDQPSSAPESPPPDPK